MNLQVLFRIFPPLFPLTIKSPPATREWFAREPSKFVRVDNERLCPFYPVIIHSPARSGSDIHHLNSHYPDACSHDPSENSQIHIGIPVSCCNQKFLTHRRSPPYHIPPAQSSPLHPTKTHPTTSTLSLRLLLQQL
jgi:hypothetical protein